MLLLSLSKGAGSRVVEVVSPTKAEGLEVSEGRQESDFSRFYQDFKFCGLTFVVPFVFTGGSLLFYLFCFNHPPNKIVCYLNINTFGRSAKEM